MLIIVRFELKLTVRQKLHFFYQYRKNFAWYYQTAFYCCYLENVREFLNLRKDVKLQSLQKKYQGM